MSRKSEHLNDCLERLLQGESLESCIKDYPEEAEELRRLLKTAGGIRRYTETVKLRPDFVAQTRAKLGIAYREMYHPRQTRVAGILKPLRRLATATALAIAILVFTLTGGFALSVRASENTMPGETMYPVKLVTEQVRLTFSFSSDRKVSYLTQFAEARAEEIAHAASNGDVTLVEATLERLEDHLARVEDIVSPNQISGVTAATEYPHPELQKMEGIVQASSAKVKAKLEEIKEPAPENKPEEPAPEVKPEEPAPEVKPEEPAPEVRPEEPAPEVRPEKPAPENKPEKPNPENKNKIIDRVDKAYSKAIEAIEAAKGNKGGKSDKMSK